MELIYLFNAYGLALACFCLWPIVFYNGYAKIKKDVFPIKESIVLSGMGCSVFGMICFINRVIPPFNSKSVGVNILPFLALIGMCATPWVAFSMLEKGRKGKYPLAELALMGLTGFVLFWWLGVARPVLERLDSSADVIVLSARYLQL